MAFLASSFLGLSISIAGLVIGMALLYLPYAAGGMGAGDVKFLGAIGAIKGPWFVFITFLATAIIGGIMAIFRIAFVLKRADMRILGAVGQDRLLYPELVSSGNSGVCEEGKASLCGRHLGRGGSVPDVGAE